MAVSPADFYAYSRATGVPLPEDPEERARMAPEVLAYRRNQLKAPQQEQQQGPDPLAVGLGIGLGLAGLGGAALGMRRLMRGPKQSVTAGVQQANLAEMAAEMSPVRRVVQETQPAPSQTPPGPSRQEVYARVAAKPEAELPNVYRPQGGVEVELITDPNTGEIFRRGKSPESFAQTYVGLRTPLAGQKTDLPEARTPGTFAEFNQVAEQRFSPRQYIEQTGAVAPAEDLTSVQQANTYQVIDQKINAVESGEDQMTGRMRQQLQRNEDLNLNDIDAAEDLTGSINAVAAQTTDGLPIDQIETARPLSSQELADTAKQEMMSLRQDLEARGLRPGTQRFENALAQSWVTKSIPGATPGTQKFQELQAQGKIDISLPTTIRKAVDVVGVGADPTGFIPERTVINIGPEAQIESTAAGTAIRGASPSMQEVPPKEELRQLYGTKEFLVPGAPGEMGQDIPGAMRVRGAMSADIPETAQSKQEIVYSFLNKPPTPEIPGGVAGTGIYGIEPGYVPGAMSKATGQYSAAASRKPTDVPKWIAKQEATPFSGVSTEGLLRAQEKSTPSAASAIQFELDRRQRTKESIAVSEVLRRARIEGRDPQDFLRRQLGRNI
jgi:hypothetical protein